MNAVSALYRLDTILDNPKYEGFGIDYQPSLLGKLNRYEDLRWDYDPIAGEWKPPSLADTWASLKTRGRVRPNHDYPCVQEIPAFSKRALNVLEDCLRANGEILPFNTGIGEYYLYNCTTIADIIDFKNSKIDYLNAHTILEIDHLEIHHHRVKDLTIFTMRKWPGRCLVTDNIARRIREAKLEGFEFRKIWPLPIHIPYWLYNKHSECHDVLTAQPHIELLPIRGNSVVLRLEFSAEEPSPIERQLIERFADEVDIILVDPQKKAEYYGCLEGTEIIPWEARYFFSCPDADKLANKLKSWAKALEWPGRSYLLKRHGDYVDTQAAEEYVSLDD
jgi:hypothetical protein